MLDALSTLDTGPEAPPSPETRALRALAVKGAAQQWSLDDIDWDIEAVVPAWLPRKFHAALISQFYHGERATIRMCRALLDGVTDPLVRRCLNLQIEDEERHARVYTDYLARIGDFAPPEPALEAAFAEALSWSGPPQAMVSAFNIILEGEALRALEDLGGWLPCPLFQRINVRICRDEARHFAFGRIYLKATMGGLDQSQRLDIFRRLKGLWRDTAFGTLDGFWIPGLITRRRRRNWAEEGWQVHLKSLIEVGLIGSDELPLVEPENT